MTAATRRCNPPLPIAISPLSSLFLSKGANVNAANTSAGEVKFGKIQLIKLTPLMLASTYCSADLVKTLLDAKANVNARDIREMTPLAFAVSSESQNAAVVNLLLKAGADVNAKTKTGETALDWAENSAIPKSGRAESRRCPRRPSLHAAGPQTRRRPAPLPKPWNAAPRFCRTAPPSSSRNRDASAVTISQSASLAVSAARGAGVHVDDAAAKCTSR